MLGVLREVVATATAGAATTAASSVLFEAPTVATERSRDAAAAAAAHGPLRSPGPAGWRASASTTRCERLARPWMRRAGDVGRGAAGPRGRRAGAGRRRLADDCVRQLLLNDPWEWRAVWIAGLAALQEQGLRGRADGVQRRLRPGAGGAGAQAGPRARLRAGRRARTSPRASTAPAPPPTPPTSRPRPSAWPGCGPRATTAGVARSPRTRAEHLARLPESQRLRAALILAEASTTDCR